MKTIDYIDKTIVYLKNKKEDNNRKKTIDLTKGIMINKENYCFEQKRILNSKVSFFLPTGFFLMGEEAIKEKYPSLQRPNIILTNYDKSINFTFSIITDRKQDIFFTKQAIKQAIKAVYPSNLFYEDGIFEHQNSRVCYFDFKSFSLDGQIYNMMFIFLLDEQVVIGNFNCRFEFYEEWRPILIKIIESIEIVE